MGGWGGATYTTLGFGGGCGGCSRITLGFGGVGGLQAASVLMAFHPCLGAVVQCLLHHQIICSPVCSAKRWLPCAVPC